MFWLFLFITLLFIAGSLLNMRPSPRQKQLALLRSKALEQKLHVKLPVSLSFPSTCEKSEYTYYCKQRKFKPDQAFVHFLRDEHSNIRITPERKMMDEQMESLKKVLLSLPDFYNAIYIGNGLFGVSWDETEIEDGGVPNSLILALNKIEDLIFS